MQKSTEWHEVRDMDQWKRMRDNVKITRVALNKPQTHRTTRSNSFAIVGITQHASRIRRCVFLERQFFNINPFKRRVKSHLPSAGIIRSSPYSPR